MITSKAGKCGGGEVPVLWTMKDVARQLGISHMQWWRMSRRKLTPTPVRLGRCVRWLREEIILWLRAQAPDLKTWLKHPDAQAFPKNK